MHMNLLYSKPSITSRFVCVSGNLIRDWQQKQLGLGYPLLYRKQIKKEMRGQKRGEVKNNPKSPPKRPESV